MDSVQRLRAIARQTGTLKSTPQQKIITATSSAAPATSTSTSTTTASRSSSAVTSSAPAPVIIKIESTDPNVVYVPAYNPSVVYGAWPDAAYPPVYLPPPPGEQFTNSFVKGFVLASASPPPTPYSAISTGMTMTIIMMTIITITMMIITATTRTTAIISIST